MARLPPRIIRTERAEEIAWAAGLFEGEGCISKQHAGICNYPLLRLSLVSTDHDIVCRFRAIFGNTNTIGGPKMGAKSKKPFWTWSTAGAEARRILALLYPYLGKRRRATADAILALVGDRQFTPRPARPEICSVGGCAQQHYGRGMCKHHYGKWYRAQARIVPASAA